MKYRFIKTIFLCLAFFNVSSAEDKKVYLVTGDEAFPPLTGMSLPSGGMFTEVATLAFKRMGYDPEVDYENWEIGKNLMLKRQAYVASFPYVKNRKRERFFVYSRPIYVSSKSIFKRKNERWDFRDIKNNKISEKKIGCRPVGYHLDGLESLIDEKKIIIHRPDTMTECFEDLISGKVDFTLFIDFIGDKWLTENDTDNMILKEDQAVGEDTFHLIFPRTNMNVSALVNGFNNELKKMEQSGELDDIIKFHLNHYYLN